MSEEIKKINVFPSQAEIDEANSISEKLNNQIFEKLKEDGVYNNINASTKFDAPTTNQYEIPVGEQNAAAEMKRRTDEIIKLREQMIADLENLDEEARNQAMAKQIKPYVVRPELAEKTIFRSEIKYGGKDEEIPEAPKPSMSNFKVETTASDESISEKLRILNDKIDRLSIPQDNVPFDTIPLPSKGKFYQNRMETIDVAYLNASDENILTNPNLLESGRFLEVLINRKLLHTNIRYKDLHVGDRNAIMIWLRSTAYGSEYPISVYDPETGSPFETVIDLSKLKMIELSVDTDNRGFIDYKLPISKNEIKFKFLSVGDLDDIDAHNEKITKELGPEFLDTNTYILKKQIKAINGNYDRNVVEAFVDQMLLGDLKEFRKYVDSIESGMDMNLTVGTPGGESIKTFLPLNFNFFWPEQ